MNMQEKLALIEELLDIDEGTLTPETELATVEEWDSIAGLSFIAMLDEEFEKTVAGKQLRTAKTVADLLAFMEK